jgi:hypothetical protein
VNKQLQVTSDNEVSNIKRCRNCNTELLDQFCQHCGQKDVDLSKPFKSIVHSLLDNWFSLDNKLVKSIPLLLLKPGFLSREFADGKRVRYSSPLKLFLFASLAYFFLLGLSDNNLKIESNVTFNEKESSHSIVTDSITTPKPNQAPGKGLLESRLEEKIKNPQQLKNTIIKGFSYMFFLLMPLFALLLSGLLKRTKRMYVDHLIFSVHFHTFGFYIFSIPLLFKLISGIELPFHDLMGLIVIPGYLALAINNFYEIKIWKSGLISTLLLALYAMVFTVTLIASVLVVIII